MALSKKVYWGGVLLIAIAAAVTGYFIFLSDDVHETQLIRLFDQEDFLDSIKDNVTAQGRTVRMRYRPNQWLKAGDDPSGENSFWSAPFLNDVSAESLFIISPQPISAQRGNQQIPFVSSFQAAMDVPGPALFPGYAKRITTQKDFNSKGTLNIRFRNDITTNKVVVAIRTSYQKIKPAENDKFLVTVILDGKDIGQILPIYLKEGQNRRYHIPQELIEPGEHTLELRVEGPDYDPAIERGRYLHVSYVEVISAVKRMYYKQPSSDEKPNTGEGIICDVLYPTPFPLSRLTWINPVSMDNRAPSVSSPVIKSLLHTSENWKRAMRSTVLFFPFTLSSQVTLPPDARLDFSYGFFWDLPQEYMNFAVSILDEEGNLLKNERINLYDSTSDFWFDRSMDLSDLEGKKVTVRFSMDSPYKDRCSLILGEPIISSAKRSDSAPPNVILISLDTLRRDHLGAYGYERETSPNLDRIADESVLFTNMFAQSCFTGNAHQVMLSGVFSLSHNFFNGASRFVSLPNAIPSIATHLKNSGYKTTAITGGAVMNAVRFAQGFDTFEEAIAYSYDIKENGDIRKMSLIGFDPAYRWLDNNADGGPFFMFLHTYAPHLPFGFPREYDEYFKDGSEEGQPATLSSFNLSEMRIRLNETGILDEKQVQHVINCYDRGIRYMDDEIGNLYSFLEERGLLENTILIFTSDHGEQFFEHGDFSHTTLYDEMLTVPLIVRFPDGKDGGKKIDDVAFQADIVPTILDYLDIDTTMTFHGESVMPLLEESGSISKGRVSMIHKMDMVGIRTDKYKFFINTDGKEELYDLSADALEKNNLLDGTLDAEHKPVFSQFLNMYAHALPGWNVLVEDNESYDEFSVNVEGLSVPDSLFSTGNHLFSKESDNFDIAVGVTDYSTRVFPALVSFAGTYEDTFSIGLSAKKDGQPVNVGLVKPGDSAETAYSEPFLISARTMELFSFDLRNFLVQPGAVSSAVKVFFNSLVSGTVEMMQENNMGSETENQLRNMGYIQ